MKRRRSNLSARLGLVTAVLALCAVVQPSPASTAETLDVSAKPCEVVYTPPQAGKVRIRFMGVSTLLVEDDATQILVDGFFTRPHWLRVKFGQLQPNLDRIRDGLCRGGVGKPAAVLVAHGHYDHAMDAAEIVAARGGKLVGSPSVGWIGRGRDLPEARIEEFEGERAWAFGSFRVTAIPSPHAGPDRWEGDITAKLVPPVKVNAYRNGGGFSFLVERGELAILVHPSAGSMPGMYATRRADVVFLGIGGLGKKDAPATVALWKEAVVRTGARAVYPIHWDNLTRPLDRKLTRAPLLDDVGKTLDRLDRLEREEGGRARLRPLLQAFESISCTVGPQPVCLAD